MTISYIKNVPLMQLPISNQAKLGLTISKEMQDTTNTSSFLQFLKPTAWLTFSIMNVKKTVAHYLVIYSDESIKWKWLQNLIKTLKYSKQLEIYVFCEEVRKMGKNM